MQRINDPLEKMPPSNETQAPDNMPGKDSNWAGDGNVNFRATASVPSNPTSNGQGIIDRLPSLQPQTERSLVMPPTQNMQRSITLKTPEELLAVLTRFDDNTPPSGPRMLTAGTHLHDRRYLLHDIQMRQEWLSGAYETMWYARDIQRAGSFVTVSELVLPESNSMVGLSIMRAATMALTSIGRYPHVPKLWDAFSEEGRNFFVFASTSGESILARMRRTGRVMAEHDVIEICLQIVDVLDVLTQQMPPLVHGFIRPEHIIMHPSGTGFMLSNFSVVLAGGGTKFVDGIDRACLMPYAAPEFVRGMIDTRSDLYSLIATAYHALTGSMPISIDGGGTIPSARRINPRVSPEFDALLARGLRADIHQRFQHPTDLRQELRSVRTAQGVSGSLVYKSGPLLQGQPALAQIAPPDYKTSTSISQVLPNLLASDSNDMERPGKSVLPHPEDLFPMGERNDWLMPALWLIGIVLCLLLIVLLSRGFM